MYCRLLGICSEKVLIQLCCCQIMDAMNVVVVVTRWFGGVHLGPDRFRHINNAARQVLHQASFVTNKK